jgi:predicted nucleic acid-binding protein
VFFDLYNVQVLPEFFALDLEIHTSDFVYNEILQAEQKQVFEVFERSKKLKIISFSIEEEKQVRDFKTTLSIRSIADKTILWKALQLKAILLTCDNKLRKEAENLSIEVHGSVWGIQQLVDQSIIGKAVGAKHLENLKITNNRLPVTEIDKLITKWKNKKNS